EIDESEFAGDIDRAFEAIAKEVKLPGFRNGKAPRKLLESRIGIGPARAQALRDAIPSYLMRGVREHDIDLVATPSVEVTGGAEDGPVEFEVDNPSVSDEDLDEAVRGQMKGHGTLVDTGAPVADGDFVTIDLSAMRDGEELPGLNIEEWSYEVGQGWVTDDFDEQLRGSEPGADITFSSVPKGTEEPADFSVKLAEVKRLELPELNDEWVADNIGEFETVDEWRESIREQQQETRLNAIRQGLVAKATDALVELVEIEPPESMVTSEAQGRLRNMVQQFQAQGIDFSAWMSATGQTPDDLMDNMKEQAETSVKADLALRAIAVAEDLEVSGDELDAEYHRMALQYQQSPDEIRKTYERNDAVDELVATIRKSKALDWLLHHVEMVDVDGTVLDRDLILGHDHDHDHDDLDDASAAADGEDDDVSEGDE
ncbi:MAG: trigger factor, partial [Ilumatobacter sp.]